MTRRERCGRCGKPAAGFAWINDQRYCHGDDADPSCYMLEQWEDAVDLAEATERLVKWEAEGRPMVSFDQVRAQYKESGQQSPRGVRVPPPVKVTPETPPPP